MKRIDQVEGTFDRDKEKKRATPSDATVRRLPRYYRYLSRLLDDGILRISSSRLATRMGVTASQIRQDFSCFGDFGQQGYGYNVRYLYNKISRILGMKDGHRAVFIGWNDSAHALLSSPTFANGDITPVAVFAEVSPRDLPCYPLQDLREVLPRLDATIAVLNTAPASAQDVLSVLADCGIRGVLNYTTAHLTTPNTGMTIQNVYLDDPCLLLCYQMGSRACED